MSGRAKARREAKARAAADRNVRRADAELKRRWTIHVKPAQFGASQTTVAMNDGLANALYEQMAGPLVFEESTVIKPAAWDHLNAAAVMDAQPVPTTDRQVYEPHCEMAWAEQCAGMDDMGGIPNDRNGDAT